MSLDEMRSEYQIQTKGVPTIYFVGVSTKKSSIMNIFPRRAVALGFPETTLEGVDHSVHDTPQSYRQTVAQIKFDNQSLGALVTTHKIDLLEAAGDLFDVLDRSVQLTGEVSCISKRENLLVGNAKDPLTAGMSLDAVLGSEYFARSGGEVLLFGAGGSGRAISLHLIQKESARDRPKRVVVVNRSAPRLTFLQEMVAALRTDIEFEFVCNDLPQKNDSIMAKLPPGSLVINATGMGKDRPGSPVTDNGCFPERGVAWELNYRGALDFWHQAKAQEENRGIKVEDGWLYFLNGWSQHIAEILHFSIDRVLFDTLAHIAKDLKP